VNDSVSKRFILFKINVLKLTVLLTAFLAFFFFLFHLLNEGVNYLLLVELFLIGTSFFIYKFVSEKNYKFYASIEFFVILFSILVLSIFYYHDIYAPIWMFGTLIVFTLCTDLYLGIFFLIVTMIMFDLLFFKRVNFYSFLTLNMQFIAYFMFGVILIKKIEKLQEETFIYEKFLFDSSSTDSLTELFNRKHFETISKKLLEKAKRNNEKVLFLILDIDYFKKVNDTFGHPIGDVVLKKVAKEIKNSLRKSDLIGRIGGEEFAILIDNYKEGFDIINKIKENVNKLTFKVDDKKFNVTVSIGGIIAKNYDYDYLYKKADEALYEAKKERNKIVVK